MGTYNEYNVTDNIGAASARISKLVELSEERLEKLGDKVTKKDIQFALHERDKSGNPTASVSLVMEYIDKDTFETKKVVQKINTVSAEVGISGGSDFATLKLSFDHKLDNDKIAIWRTLESYGEETARIDDSTQLIPCISIVAVPLMLGGKYALVCVDPTSWSLQPVDPYKDDSNQIRIDFHVEDTDFLYNRNFDMKKVAAELKSEMVSEKWNMEYRIRKEEEKRAYAAARDKEIMDMMNSGRESRHTFNISDNQSFGYSRNTED